MTLTAAQSGELKRLAGDAMRAHGLLPDLSPAAIAQANAATPATESGPEIRDLRSLLWSSIDNNESLDLDQIEYAERLANGDIRVLVGIAEVDAFVPKSGAIDRHAYANTTSVYTGVATFPMLP